MNELEGNHHLLMAGVCWALALLPGNWSRANEAMLKQGLSEYTAAMESQDRNMRLQGFSRAEQLFRQAIAEQRQTKGMANADLLVNLGNAALQAEHLGAAIVAYRQALLQQPSHQRARQNLQFARGLLPESVRFDPSTQLVDTLFFWRLLLSRPHLNLIAGICFLLAAALLALSLIRRSAWLRLLALLVGMIWGILFVSLIWDPSYSQSEAVVVADEAYVHSADSAGSSLRIADPLPNGTEVRVLERRERWLEIEVGGRSGWLNASQVSFVQPPATN